MRILYFKNMLPEDKKQLIASIATATHLQNHEFLFIKRMLQQRNDFYLKIMKRKELIIFLDAVLYEYYYSRMPRTIWMKPRIRLFLINFIQNAVSRIFAVRMYNA